MRILVIGAGTMGSLIAARLQESGQQVAVLAPGSQLNALHRSDLTLDENPTTTQPSSQKIPKIEKLEPDAAYDWAIVLARRNQAAGLLPILAANRRIPNILFLLNQASGPGEMVNALGKKRVVPGFLVVSGRRSGTQFQFRVLRTTFGELDGRITPRLQRLAEVLRAAGFSPVLTRNIDAWLKSYAAVIVPAASALYSAGGDNYRLARTRDGLVLLVRGIRESFQVLQALGVPVTPSYLRLIEWLPEPFAVWLLSGLLSTLWAEQVLTAHVAAEQEEIRYLAQALHSLARSTWVRTPVLNEMVKYLEPGKPPLPAGSARLPLRWHRFWIWASALISLLLLRRRMKEPGRSGQMQKLT